MPGSLEQAAHIPASTVEILKPVPELKKVAKRLRTLAAPAVDDRADPSAALLQRLVADSHRQRLQSGAGPVPFNDIGFSVFSQNEEDGLLLYIFTLLGTSCKVLVEICAGDGIECNGANLLVHHEWTGALFDGKPENIERGRNFYAHNHTTLAWPPRLEQAWVTRDNVNQLISSAGVEGEIDLLSIDIDGNDYWVWEAISVVLPRVVVLEFNHLWGPDESVTIPYDPDFVATFTEHGSDYAGASLAAFVSLGRRKGYRLVGANRFATNAFFVREDLRHPWLPEIQPGACFGHPRARFGVEVRFPRVKDRPWQRV